MPHGHFQHEIEVGFRDTDASGWMYFPNAFCFVGSAECAFLHELGVLVFDRAIGGWPRVKVECQYRIPLVAWDRITVHLMLCRVGESSLSWKFEIRTHDGRRASFGSMVTVRVDAVGKKSPIPPAEREILQQVADRPVAWSNDV